MDRTITIRLVTREMPEAISGFCQKKGDDSYLVILNDRDGEPRTAGSFIHEMLHIYHDDYSKDLPADKIELERIKETRLLLEHLTATQERDI